MLRPDVEFDDPTTEEWAAYVLEYIRDNIAITKHGFSAAEISRALDVDYHIVSSALIELSDRRRLLRSGRWCSGNVVRYVTLDFEPEPAYLTDRQRNVLDVLVAKAENGTLIIQIADIWYAMKDPPTAAAGLDGVLWSLQNKGYIEILRRGTAKERGYHIAVLPVSEERS